MTNLGPRLGESCPAFSAWLDECERATAAGDLQQAHLAWQRAVRAALDYRRSLTRQHGEPLS